jgi:hypothetical protein
LGRNDRSDFNFFSFINTSSQDVLRRPVEFTLVSSGRRCRRHIHALRTTPKHLNRQLPSAGKFTPRIAPELHERLAIVAQAEGKSINSLAEEALRSRVAG